MPINFEEFDLKEAKNTGGVTGSKRVKHRSGDYYQLKPSILSNTLLRRTKAGGVDRENFGEVIASKIGQAMLKNRDGSAAVPDVSLSYDTQKKQVSVASKYLTGNKVRTLDEYAKKHGTEFRKHAVFVSGNREAIYEGQYNIAGDKHKKFRKQLANGIAISALVGDHDVNPGNMMVVDRNIARIDFGHAFNDLLNAPKLFGGGVRNKNNQILDFLNRENIAGFPKGDKPKLWRDYPGMMPSKELADAFKNIARSTGMKRGVDSAYKEFVLLISELQKDKKTQNHILQSLKAINNAIDAPVINKQNTDVNGRIREIFDNIGEFCGRNQKQMKNVSKLMQLQVDIDNALSEFVGGDALPEEQVAKITKQYNKMLTTEGIRNQDKKSIQWIKTDAKIKACDGNLVGYIKERSDQLGFGIYTGKKFADQYFIEGVKHVKSKAKKRSSIELKDYRNSKKTSIKKQSKTSKLHRIFDDSHVKLSKNTLSKNDVADDLANRYSKKEAKKKTRDGHTEMIKKILSKPKKKAPLINKKYDREI